MGKWFTVKLIKKWSISKGKCIDHTWGFGKHQQDRRGSRPERKVFSAAWRSAFPVLPCSGVSWEQYSKPRRTALKEGYTGSHTEGVSGLCLCMWGEKDKPSCPSHSTKVHEVHSGGVFLWVSGLSEMGHQCQQIYGLNRRSSGTCLQDYSGFWRALLLTLMLCSPDVLWLSNVIFEISNISSFLPLWQSSMLFPFGLLGRKAPQGGQRGMKEWPHLNGQTI